MEYETIKSFKFVKVGKFKLGKDPYVFKSKGQEIRWENPTLCELTSKNFLNASCSTYMVMLGAECIEKNILYVGMYTETLNKRWFKNKQHENCYVSWHSTNLDDNINLLLRKLFKEPIGSENWYVGKTGEPQIIDTKLENDMNLQQRISSPIESDKDITLWITVNPFLNVNSTTNINCSTSIEQIFLEDIENLSLPYNKKGRNRPQGKRVKDIIPLTD